MLYIYVIYICYIYMLYIYNIYIYFMYKFIIGTCTMSFDRFIPHYHHQFSKQCRVSDYGFVKLIDLLDAIPHVIKV